MHNNKQHLKLNICLIGRCSYVIFILLLLVTVESYLYILNYVTVDKWVVTVGDVGSEK